MAISLQLKELVVHHGKAEAISNVSAQVVEGSITGIIGANGAGKSTIMKTISGILRPTKGEIWFQNKRIDVLPAHKIVELGIVQVPEGRRLFPNMSVLANIKIGAYLRKDRAEIKRDMDLIFRRFPILQERTHQKAATLSGGEQQMLAIARALMAKPKLLLMDEPSWGLAPLVVEEVGRTIKEISDDGITVLLVEQNAGLAFTHTDYVYVLEVGRNVLEGPTKEIMSNEAVRGAFLG
jgi:branched-chain amino acid transport system ATP-binding protein